MKKIIITVLMVITMLSFQNTSKIQEVQAQEIGIGDVIFEDNNTTIATNELLMNEISYTIVKLHLILIQKSSEINSYDSETLTTIKRLEELTKTDIIELLDISVNKEEALAKYLSDSNKELQKGDTIVNYIKQEMVILKGDMQSCIIDKNISDKVYFDAIERYDENNMETSLTDSINYQNCITKNRIQYNAKIGIINKLVFYLGLLQKKYDILFIKQDVLTKNFQIFRDNTLSDLNQINELMQQYKF